MGADISSLIGFATGPECESSSSFPFLLLPIEIRLQIYHYIIQDQPARHCHLLPLHSQRPATSLVYFDQAVPTPPDLAITNGRDPPSQTSPSPSAFPNPTFLAPVLPRSRGFRGHGCGHIPSSLLRACKQINAEARLLPFEQNEFVFINWFSSGVFAARSFMRALEPRLRNAMRYACVDVLQRDLENSWVASLVGGRPGTGEWKDLCNLWSGGEEAGLLGLKLRIMGRMGRGRFPKSVIDESSESTEDGLEREIKGPSSEVGKIETDILDVNAQWVTEGLMQMRNLKWLEIEIEDDKILREDKIRFCVELGRKLNAPRTTERSCGEGKVDVTLVERALPPQREVDGKALEAGWEAPRAMFVAGLYADSSHGARGAAL